jgi:hypothetical protein
LITGVSIAAATVGAGLVAMTPAAGAGASFTSTVRNEWVFKPISSTTSVDQLVQADVSGNTRETRNAAVTLRVKDTQNFLIANLSGTKYQVWVVTAGVWNPIGEKTYQHAATGTFRARVVGDKISASFNGVFIASYTSPAIQALSSKGTGMAIWQDTPSVVHLTNATGVNSAPTTTTTTPPTTTTTPPTTTTTTPPTTTTPSTTTTPPTTTTASGASFSTPLEWEWATTDLNAAVGTNAWAQATVAGLHDTVDSGKDVWRNAAFHLRQSGTTYLRVVFSGTRYQVYRVVDGSPEDYLVNLPFSPGGTGVARAEVSGTTVTGYWNGVQVNSTTSDSLSSLTGVGTGLGIWQEAANVV